MHGVTSTGNAGNRSTSGEGSSTETTQGQMQGGRSVQQQTSVQLIRQSFCSAMAATSTTTTAIPGTSRQVTGGDATESVRPRKRKRQRVQKPLSELRYQATKDFFKYIEELIDAQKPGASETRKPCNPESAAGADEDTFDHSCVFDRMFDRTISKDFKRSCVQKDEFREKNTLPLCLMLVKKQRKLLMG